MDLRDSEAAAGGLSVIIVGGGIAGLYAALKLARAGFLVHLLEAKDVLGGRIETVQLSGPTVGPGDSAPPFPAEMGPMRFELPLQPLFAGLCADLGVTFDDFPGPASDLVPETEILEPDERNPKTGKDLGPLDLLRLGVFRMFGKSPYVDASGQVRLPNEDQQWLEGLSDADGSFDSLRREAILGPGRTPGSTTPQPLYSLGFWNALWGCISPAASKRIRHEGTFYHLFETNPNAVEWGIFWLRLFKLSADERLSTIASGVGKVTERLQRQLESEWPTAVALHTSQVVRGIRPAPDRSGITVDVEDISGEPASTYDLTADHLILALPKEPLLRLSGPFPLLIRSDVAGVHAFTLLKIFVMVRTPPWWDEPPKPQRGARFVETREIHYLPPDRLEENSAVLLYMDAPAAAFWQIYVTHTATHDRAEVNSNDALRTMLIQSLVTLHMNWADQTATTAADAPVPLHPSDPEWRLLHENFSRIGELFSPDFATASPNVARRKILLGSLDELAGWVAGTMGDYAIRDWSHPPFGAGCHAWSPGVKSWEAMERLNAFGLAGQENPRNIHVCGEAYSDYQGFIEGSLRSASNVVANITGEF